MGDPERELRAAGVAVGEKSSARVRLRLLPKAEGAGRDGDLAAEMAAAAADYEARAARDSGRTVIEEETGLGAQELAELERAGLARSDLRAVGRRLRDLGRARDISTYRAIVEAATSIALEDLLLAVGESGPQAAD